MQRRTKTATSQPDLLESVFEAYYPAVFRYFRYRGADVETANDLASSTFERALKNVARYDPKKAQIQTWLFTIAHNLGVNHWKAKKLIAPLEDDLPIPEDPPVEKAIILNQDKEQILRALNSLDDRSRETLALKFGGRLTNRQIAELNHLSESNVGIILYRSLLKIRAILANETTEASHER